MLDKFTWNLINHVLCTLGEQQEHGGSILDYSALLFTGYISICGTAGLNSKLDSSEQLATTSKLDCIQLLLLHGQEPPPRQASQRGRRRAAEATAGADATAHVCAATTTSATAFVGLAGRTTTSAVAASHHEPPSPRARPRGAHHDHEPLSFSGAAVGDGSSSCQRRRRRHHRRHDARALVHISIDCSVRLSVAAAAVL